MDFEARLDRLAMVAVRVGLGLREGQEGVVTAPVEALPLVRAMARHAYAAGASLVTPLLTDDALSRARHEHGRDGAFDTAPGWLFGGMAEAFRAGAARLAVVGDDPDLLAGLDPDRVGRADRARAKAYKPVVDEIVGFRTNWCIVPSATPAWAARVFPGLPREEATGLLWDAIFRACRVDGPDPVAGWAAHNAALRARTALLDARRFHALRFRGPGTDLVVGLADGHAWCGGATRTANGLTCNANIPTEEVFTAPHRLRAEGTVRATRPLSYQGSLIDGIAVRFEGGEVVEARAGRGEAALVHLLDKDEGARRLGEVALVPASSPIAASGLLFYETLFDENASSHVALGQHYGKCIADDGGPRDRDGLAARGGNASLVHVDWMIGSPETDVDGLSVDGTATPVMRGGEWA